MRRIMVTGASTWMGGRVVQRLEALPGTEVYPVDEVEPAVGFRSPFAAIALDQLAFADHLRAVRPDTVMHLQTIDRSHALGAETAHAGIVVGTQMLIGAITRSPETQRLVVRSDGAIYGAGPRNPSVCDESTRPHGRLSRYQRDLADMEQTLGELRDLRPDLDLNVLRLAPVIGPTIGNPLSRYLTLNVVPTRLGFDPRLQFLYEDDAVEALLDVAERPIAGTFNVAARGHLYLSRVLRLGRRVQQPLLKRPHRAALRALDRFDLSLPADTRAMLRHGRVLSTILMEERLGIVPRLTCRQSVLATYGQIDANAAAGAEAAS